VTARISSGQRAALEQAAALVGSTLNQFVVQSAFEEARRTLERETVIQLSQAAARKVLDLVERAGGIGLFVDAKDEPAARFYRGFGFVTMPDAPLQLFLPLRTIREALGR
jgi:hypothetical protein